MEDWINPWGIILVITGVLTLILGLIFLRYPPRRINWFYGYRTSRSMRNQERWDFAQRHCAKGMLRIGFYMILIGIAGNFLPFRPVAGAFLSLIPMLVLFGVLIFRTEKALKDNFGN